MIPFINLNKSPNRDPDKWDVVYCFSFCVFMGALFGVAMGKLLVCALEIFLDYNLR